MPTHQELYKHTINQIHDLGGQAPFGITEDEKRMQTELLEALAKNEATEFTYSRTAGTGLRVPHHTDYKGESLNGSGHVEAISVSPDAGSGVMVNDLVDQGHFWDDDDDGNDVDLKEDPDEYMEL